MQIISKTGDPKFAEVYVARMREDKRALIEFVDALDPRFPREEKQVIIVSTQIGCPVGCLMCDSGTFFIGNLSKEEIFCQIDHVINANKMTDMSKHPKFKIQFARMGEPSLNYAVLEVLEELPKRYLIDGLMPCIATTAPINSDKWFEKLCEIKNEKYLNGRFQLQFSVNSTNEAERDKWMPIKKWSLKQISEYGEKFYKKGDRKITLNFALAEGVELDVSVIEQLFGPAKFLVKITPVNPTDLATKNDILTVISSKKPKNADFYAEKLRKTGFQTIISIGAPEEVAIGSNCGQSVKQLIIGGISKNY